MVNNIKRFSEATITLPTRRSSFTAFSQVSNIDYFIVSGEINVYLVKIKVVSFASEMIRFIFSLLTLDDFGFLHCFKSGRYLRLRFVNTSNAFVSELNYQVWYAFSYLESMEHSSIKIILICRNICFPSLYGKHSTSTS